MGPASSPLSPLWYSGTQCWQATSLHANSSLVAKWDPHLPNVFPTSQFFPTWHIWTCLFSGSPPWYSGTHHCQTSSPHAKCIPSCTVGPTHAQILPYFMNFCLVVQWVMPPLSFHPDGTVGPIPVKLLPHIQINIPSGTVSPTPAQILPYFMISSLVASPYFHCTTREELERRWVPLYHQGRTREEVGPTVPPGKN